jgi:hypothetical protein
MLPPFAPACGPHADQRYRFTAKRRKDDCDELVAPRTNGAISRFAAFARLAGQDKSVLPAEVFMIAKINAVILEVQPFL